MYSKDSVPTFDAGQGSTRIKHKEFVQVINSGVLTSGVSNFTLEDFRINPANAALFPWLSRIAQQYTEHRWHGLVMMYKPTSGESITSTNTALGRVIMATQYNVYEPPFLNIQQMESTQFSVSTKPSNGAIHGIECAKFKNVNTILYNDDSTSNDDQRFEDVGKFSIATQGMQGQYTELGELWVSYDVELIKPRLIGTANLFDHIINRYDFDPATNLDMNPLRFNIPLSVIPGPITPETYKYTTLGNQITGYTPQSSFGVQFYINQIVGTGSAVIGTNLVDGYFPSWFYGKVKVDIYWCNDTGSAANNSSVAQLFQLTSGSPSVAMISQPWIPNAGINIQTTNSAFIAEPTGSGYGYTGAWFNVSGGPSSFFTIQNTAIIAAGDDKYDIPSCYIYITALPYNFD